MTTIVMNTMNGAVSEYTGWAFQSITPTKAGTATGLFSLGGDTDDGTAIVGRVQTGKVEWGGSRKSLIDKAFLALKGTGTFRLHVSGEAADYTYDFTAAASGQSSAQPGKGIRENYLSFGFSNPSGQAFQLDAIEMPTLKSPNRRV